MTFPLFILAQMLAAPTVCVKWKCALFSPKSSLSYGTFALP